MSKTKPILYRKELSPKVFHQLNLWNETCQDDWTFKGHPTRLLTHCYHDYPAKMIPQIAGKLIDLYGQDVSLIFDPYCGTGTSLVEANIRGIDALGTEINPLAVLIATAKTTIQSKQEIQSTIEELRTFCKESSLDNNNQPLIENVRLDFWFKPEAIEKLSILKSFIDMIKENGVKLFFQTVFSETVREASNTRISEFKLYRYTDEVLKSYIPDVFAIMQRKLERNYSGLNDYLAVIEKLKRIPKADVFSFNTVDGIPADIIQPNSVGLIITSPPYGDSHTTVAYGQYSKLSSAWLGLKDPASVDSRLMGGRLLKEIIDFPCHSLNETIKAIANVDIKRAREVASFYADLLSSIRHVSTVLKKNGIACYVVGNRKVKGIVLPTNEAICSFFKEQGFVFENEFTRDIPNKRMPLTNSPSNIVGARDTTMTQEYVIVMRKVI